MEEKVKTFKSVGTIASFTILSFILSLILQMLLAYLYGARSAMDVYFLALSIPLFISGIITSAMAVIFIPLFKEFIVKDNEEGLWAFINTVISYLIVILSVITLIIFFFAPVIINKISVGFTADSKVLAFSLLRIFSFSIIPLQLYTLFIIIYYSRESFFKPAFIRLLNPLSIIIFAVLFNRLLGIKGPAYGFVFGSLAQFFIMLYFLKKENPRFKFRFYFAKIKNDNLWGVALIVMISICIFGLIDPVERFIASNLSGGSVSYLGYVERIFSIIILLPNMAIPFVILPQLAGHYAVKDIQKLRRTFSTGIRSTLFITIPLVITLFIFREPLVYVFLQRGAFDRQATLNTAVSLGCYLGVFFESERLVILNTLYAMKDVVTPLYTGIIAFIIYLLVALSLLPKMSFAGLALAHSAAFLSFSIMNIFILRKKLGYIDGKRIFLSAIKIILSASGAGLAMWSVFNLWAGYSQLAVFLRMAVSIFTGIIAYLGFCFLLKLDDLTQFYNVLVSYKQQLFLKIP